MIDIRTPASRASDPRTSHEAEAAHTGSGGRRAQQERTRTAVGLYPGYTSLDLAAVTGLDRYMLARRLPELESAGLVRKGPPVCSSNGKRAVTWWPVPIQERLL